jgi:hypothetical protein
MQTKASAFFYNFESDDRTRQIRRYLHRAGVSTRIITTPDFLQPLGALFELPGFERTQVFNLGQNFTEEMLVMHGFSEEQLDAFLQFLRGSRLPGIDLKAILTEVNSHWTSMQLYQELTRERDAVMGRTN